MAVNLYQVLRPTLFALNAERAHQLSLKAVELVSRHNGLCSLISKLGARHIVNQPVEVMGLSFPNPIGLAAGLDKDAVGAPLWAALGFGFVELGTVTPRPQPGNPKPRLFRLSEDHALINRFGFNSVGIDQFINNVKRHSVDIPVGINLGKNASTSIANANEDYLVGLRAAYPCADYVTINISSPNTRDLRDLQQEQALELLLAALKQEQSRLSDHHNKYLPIAIKIAPDLDQPQLKMICEQLLKHEMDAVIACNTTTARPNSLQSPYREQGGGLSGHPLRTRSTEVIEQLAVELGTDCPIIGVGGIETAEDVHEKLAAGASLVQLYSSLIYQGPGLIRRILRQPLTS